MRWFVLLMFLSLPALAQDAGTIPMPATDWKETLLMFFWKFVLPLLGSILLGFATMGLHKLQAWLTEKAKTAKVAGVALQLETLVEHFVADAEVSLKPKFDKAMGDGKLTKEEGAALKAEVIKQLKEKTAPEVMAAIKAMFGEGAIDTILGGAIEKVLSKMG